MVEKDFQISMLIQKQLRQELSEAEKSELFKWAALSADNQLTLDELNDEKWLTAELKKFSAYNEVGIREKLNIKLKAEEYIQETQTGNVRRMSFTRWVAAAAIIAIVTITVMLSLSKDETKQGQLAKTQQPPTDIAAPVSTKARITLADGRTVSVDSLTSGTLVNQGGIRIIKNADGSITYDAPTSLLTSGLSPVFNTLTNPRGSTIIDMTLADGSRVWLNAGSSITYPVAFVGKQRKISIAGEVFVKVAKNKLQPFIASANGMEVLALGTEFNINSFEDEENITTTLIEGSVKVSKGTVYTTLKPGQQTHLDKTGGIKVTDADVDEAMAWKNGRFIFQGNNIQSVMRQMARWYDVEVNYTGNVTEEEFVGVINRSRYDNISQILDMLEKTRTVSFAISGRTITVMPIKK